MTEQEKRHTQCVQALVDLLTEIYSDDIVDFASTPYQIADHVEYLPSFENVLEYSKDNLFSDSLGEVLNHIGAKNQIAARVVGKSLELTGE